MQDKPNPLGADYWNADGGRSWVDNIDRTEALLDPLNRRLMAGAAAQPGERVLDVGCGGARTSRQFASRVAPRGDVVGVDISAPILDVARARSVGIANLRLELADAATAPLGDACFDLVTSRFGVMFFDDPVRAFTNLFGTLRPGGRMVFMSWRPLEENVGMAAPGAAAAALLPPQPPPEPDMPGPFALGDVERTTRLLGQAGFADIMAQAVDETMDLGPVESALDYLMHMGSVGKLLKDADHATVGQVRAAVARVLEAHVADGAVRMSSAAWLVSARRRA